MERVQLAGTELTTTRLGFGCAKLLRVGTSRARLRLLEEAFDLGIRHFDVARMYGLGRAEAELGRFARDKRDDLVLATKFGVRLSARARRLQAIQGVARRAIALFPATRGVLRRKAHGLLAPRRYDVEEARVSLETSLRELGTDRIDLYFLHEPTLEDLRDDGLYEFLENEKSRGRIRAYGVSGELEEVERIRASIPRLVPVAQFPNDAISRNLDRLGGGSRPGIVTYSPISGALGRIVGHVRRDAATRRRWRDAVGVDCASTDAVARLLLRYGLAANPWGPVLFSTSRGSRLRRLVESHADPPGGDEPLRRFLERIDDEILRSRSGDSGRNAR